MKFEKTNNELEIQQLDNFEIKELSLLDSIIENQTEKTNSLYKVLREQYLEWKKILINILSSSTNKSIALHIMFLIVEIYIKAECVRDFNIIDVSDRISGINYKKNISYFDLMQIGHNLNYFFGIVKNGSPNFPLSNYTDILKIKERIDDLELPDAIKEDYMSLRYNCRRNGDFLCVDNEINERDIERIKEVINIVI